MLLCLFWRIWLQLFTFRLCWRHFYHRKSSELDLTCNWFLGFSIFLKNLGHFEYFLGVEVKKVPDGLLLSQFKYILDIFSELDMQDCKWVLTPMFSGKLPRAADGSPPANATFYRHTLGKLQYLSFTWLDISYAVNKLSQFIHEPTDEHGKAINRILWYHKATTTLGLWIRPNSYYNLYM